MSESTMAEILNLRASGKNAIKFELRGVPVSFANALRRIMLADIHTVVLRDIQILENTSQLPHEMLRHRVEMLPINVRPSETRIIAETKVEIRVPAMDETQTITTKHFTVTSDRKDILMKDDAGNDLLFLYLNPGEAVHVTARLGVDLADSSQVSTVSYGFHVDEELAREDKDEYLSEVPESDKALKAREFDNFHIQRSYARDEAGQSFWYDFFVETWGVNSPKEVLRQSIALLKAKLYEWQKTPITREGSLAVVESRVETHTIGALVQRVLLDRGKTTRAFYDVPHPLVSLMVVKFETADTPETVLADTVGTINTWCDMLDAQLSR
jgi:DNA-directed RNA polymerase subunit L